ncbi:MAG: hypothetical protein ABL982_07705 [Vicinamibacterales bacterium]
MRSRLLAALLLALPTTATLAPTAFAQCIQKEIVQEAWVDPVDGFVPGIVGDPTTPFLQINDAILAVQAALVGSGPGKEGVVHLMPGLYSDTGTQPQFFPVNMRDRVHVQGAGAKECVLRVRTAAPILQRYLPLAGTTPTPIGMPNIRRQGVRIAVSYFNATTPTDYAEEMGPMLDGVTIQGADIQVSVDSEFLPVRGRVSNCVFDMRNTVDVEGEGWTGPQFGVLICAVYNLAGSFVDRSHEREYEHDRHYPTHHVHLLNNTFLFGGLRDYEAGAVDFAEQPAVGICDFAEPLDQDPIQILRGINRHNIQNNLFRMVDGNPNANMATLGIDVGDAHVLVGSGGVLPRPTNAFDAGTAGITNGTYESFAAPLPLPAVDMTLEDPAFVGEYLTVQTARYVRDLRLLPDSILVDQGASPADPDGDGCFVLTAVNELAYYEIPQPLGTIIDSSFDFDGEVHGNPRVVGEDIDIGFDETDALITAGSYGNDTKSHEFPWRIVPDEMVGVPTIPTGGQNRNYIVPDSANVAFGLTHFINLDPTLFTVVPQVSWTNMPGTLAMPLVIVLPPPVTVWLNPIPAGVTTPIVPQAYANWQADSIAPHLFKEFIWTVADGGSPGVVGPLTAYLSAQVLFIDVLGNLILSNLQSEYF